MSIGTIPQTPLAATLDSVNWLEAMLHGREAAPSAVLKEFFAAAAHDLASISSASSSASLSSSSEKNTATNKDASVSEVVEARVRKLTELLSSAAASDWHGSSALLSRSRIELIIKLYVQEQLNCAPLCFFLTLLFQVL